MGNYVQGGTIIRYWGDKDKQQNGSGAGRGDRGRNRARIRDRDRGGNRTVARTHMG